MSIRLHASLSLSSSTPAFFSRNDAATVSRLVGVTFRPETISTLCGVSSPEGVEGLFGDALQIPMVTD